MSEVRRIAVVGAGLGGLTAALALLQRGFEVDVYEQASALGDVGAGVQVSANGTRVLFALGLEDDVMDLAVGPQGKEVRLWSTGQTWKIFDLGPMSIERYGSPYVTLHRADLHAALVAGVRRARPDAIALEARCVGLEQDDDGVTLRFADGAHARADLVVAADGIHSRVRELLFGAQPAAFTGLMAWRGVVPVERLPEHMRRPVASNWVGPGGHVVHYPLRRGELMNFVGAIERDDWLVESWNVAGTTDECLADFAGWHPDVHALIRAVETPYKWALLARPPMDAWSVDRVTLLGDACHPTLPFMAQGAVMAIEDGLVLARAVAAHPGDHTTAFARYFEARHERTARVVRASHANTERFQSNQLADAQRAQAYVDAEFEEGLVRERYEWLYTYDATAVPV